MESIIPKNEFLLCSTMPVIGKISLINNFGRFLDFQSVISFLRIVLKIIWISETWKLKFYIWGRDNCSCSTPSPSASKDTDLSMLWSHMKGELFLVSLEFMWSTSGWCQLTDYCYRKLVYLNTQGAEDAAYKGSLHLSVSPYITVLQFWNITFKFWNSYR